MSTSFLLGLLSAIVVSMFVYLVSALSVARKESSITKYLYAGTTLTKNAIVGTIFASGMSLATVIVAIIQLGILFGIALLWAVITYCFGWILLALLAKKIRNECEHGETLLTFLGRKYRSPSLRRFASLATIIGFLGAFAVEILAVNILLGSFIAEEWVKIGLLILMAALTIVYAAVGGFSTIIKTDRIQSLFIIPAILILIIMATQMRIESGSQDLIDFTLFDKKMLPVQLFISLFLINVGFPIVDTSAWQRVRAAENGIAIKNGAIIASIGFFLTWSLLLLCAFILSGTVQAGADPVVELLKYSGKLVGVWGYVVGFILLIGLLAAMFSTADTFLNAASTTFLIDQRRGEIQPLEEALQETTIGAMRNWVFLLGTVGFIFCFWLSSVGFGIVALVFAFYGGTIALLPSVVIALFVSNKDILERLSYWAVMSTVLGFISAWVIGFHGVICQGKTAGFCAIANGYITPNAYQAPIYAFAISLLIVSVGVAMQWFVGEQNESAQ